MHLQRWQTSFGSDAVKLVSNVNTVTQISAMAPRNATILSVLQKKGNEEQWDCQTVRITVNLIFTALRFFIQHLLLCPKNNKWQVEAGIAQIIGQDNYHINSI